MNALPATVMKSSSSEASVLIFSKSNAFAELAGASTASPQIFATAALSVVSVQDGLLVNVIQCLASSSDSK